MAQRSPFGQKSPFKVVDVEALFVQDDADHIKPHLYIQVVFLHVGMGRTDHVVLFGLTDKLMRFAKKSRVPGLYLHDHEFIPGPGDDVYLFLSEGPVVFQDRITQGLQVLKGQAFTFLAKFVVVCHKAGNGLRVVHNFNTFSLISHGPS